MNEVRFVDCLNIPYERPGEFELAVKEPELHIPNSEAKGPASRPMSALAFGRRFGQ